jgi:phosphate-selective porin OprO/OprP
MKSARLLVAAWILAIAGAEYPRSLHAQPPSFQQPGFPQASFPQPGFPQPGSADPIAPEINGELAELTRRLEAAERHIDQLESRTAPEGSYVYEADETNAPAVVIASEDESDLKERVLGWLDDHKKNTYPNITINGVFQADVGFFSQDSESIAAHGILQDGADFRRARLSAKGAVTENVNYMFQMDFAFFGRPTFTDLYVEQVGVPLLGNIRLGQWKQPFSLEVVSSFRYTTFMERSVLFQPFTPFRHIGAGFYDHSEDLRTTWAASFFRAGQDQFGGSISLQGGWAFCERITHLFAWDEPSGGRYYLHGGLGHFFSAPPNRTFNFRTIPEIYIGDVGNDNQVGTSGQPTPGPNNGTPFFVATGPLNIWNFNVLGAELLWVNGPLSLQAEAMVNFLDLVNAPTATLQGGYAQVGYFLTGEHRPYDRAAGAIDRVKPFTNFFWVDTSSGHCLGWGAWEVAARISTIDLNDQNVRGGTLTDFTAGINWYWNPYTKLVFNYIHAWNDSTRIDPQTQLAVGDNNTSAYAGRVQIDF